MASIQMAGMASGGELSGHGSGCRLKGYQALKLIARSWLRSVGSCFTSVWPLAAVSARRKGGDSGMSWPGLSSSQEP